MLSFCPRPDEYGIDVHQLPKDRYRIIGRIAAGSMAQVYLAEMRTGRGHPPLEVALKRLRPELQNDHHFVQMFFDEARTASVMDHPNIARIVELGELDGSFFMALEMVYGASLRSISRRLRARREVFPLPVLLRIAVSALRGLGFAHQATDPDGRPLRIVHRDVSPQNILVGYDGDVKLIDFGVAKAERNLHKTMPGLIKGTFAYMAPEQIRGEAIDGRADLFAFSETIYEAATLHHPFFDPPESAKLEALFNQEPFDPGRFVRRFPSRVREVLFKAMAKAPRERFANAEEMSAALEDILRDATATQEDVGDLVKVLFPNSLELLRQGREQRDPELLVRALRVDDPSASTEDIEILEPSIEDPAEPQVLLPPFEPRGLLEAPRTQPEETERIKLSPRPEWSIEARVNSPAGIEAFLTTWTGRFGITRHGILKRSTLDAPRAARDAIIHEARVLALLANCGARALYDAGDHDNRPYLVAEHSPGSSLREIFDHCIRTKNEIPTALTCWLIAELASVLVAVDTMQTPGGEPLGLLLDDLTPSSARITMQGAMQLDDLISSRSRLGTGLTDGAATTAYRPAASEFRESPASRTVYALGVILYESVLVAYLGQTSESLEAIVEHTTSNPYGAWRVPIAIAEPVLAVVTRAIAKNPADRHPNVHAVEIDLHRVLLRLGQPITRTFASSWIARLLAT